MLDSVIPSTADVEEARYFQIKYKKNVLSFVKIAEQLGNFFDNNHKLVPLPTQQVMEDDVVASPTQLIKLGKDLHANFVKQTLQQTPLPVTNTLKPKKILTFANRPGITKKGGTSAGAHKNSSLITKLFLSLQSRPDADIEEFFRYENQKEPPSLSNHGSQCLNAPTARSAESKIATVVVLDMTAVVHIVWAARLSTHFH